MQIARDGDAVYAVRFRNRPDHFATGEVYDVDTIAVRQIQTAGCAVDGRVVPAAGSSDDDVPYDVICGAGVSGPGECESKREFFHGCVTYADRPNLRNSVHRAFILNVDDGGMKKLILILAMVLSVTGLSAAATEKPKISMKKAKAIALKKVPGGKIQSAELENEGGKPI